MIPIPASIKFYGHQSADLFSREIQESIKGVFNHNLVNSDVDQFPRGFVKTSLPGHPWDDTCWTRDCGIFLREAALWGHLDQAIIISDYLLTHVTKNPEGFYTYPMFLKGAEKGCGDELDGTAAIIIGMVRLWQRLPAGHNLKDQLYRFLSDQASPVAYISSKLDQHRLVAGSGEFGGGWGVDGEWCNVVQNSLLRQVLLVMAEVESENGNQATTLALQGKAARLLALITQNLVDPKDGSWIWCIDPHTMKPDLSVSLEPRVKGTASINGAGSCYADGEGLDPVGDTWPAAQNMIATLNKIYNQYPVREEQFAKYGMCTFVDADPSLPLPGYTSWLSYCDCYAAQILLLLDKTDLLDKVVTWITAATYMAGSPSADFIRELSQGNAAVDFNRSPSAFWFTERNFSPDYKGVKDIGCGKLNLVNVAEPMKLARLMLGIDDRYSEEVRMVPRLPDSWIGMQASNWLVKTKQGVVSVDVIFERNQEGGFDLQLTIEEGQIIPYIDVRFPDGTRKGTGPVSGSYRF